MKASVIISTKNRCDELRITLQSCIIQTADPEIIVIDDGSTDGTMEMVQSEFPQAKLVQVQQSQGCIVQRNRGAELAIGDILFSIDDDAEYSTPHVIEQTLADFDDPRIAVVAIPLIEPNLGDRRLQWPPDYDHTWISDSFKGTSYAIRRAIFIEVGSFRAELTHQGEESDLAIRLLDLGYFVRLGRADPIIHYESPKRDLRRMHYFGRRNDLLFAAWNVPARYFLVHMLGTTINGLRYSLKVQQRSAMFSGIMRGWLDCFAKWPMRKAVTLDTYRLIRKLKKRGACPIEEIAA